MLANIQMYIFISKVLKDYQALIVIIMPKNEHAHKNRVFI